MRALLERQPQMQLSLSFTTRPARAGEIDGHDYLFVDAEEFERRREAGEFLEWAQVHGSLYATSREWIERRIAAGEDIVLEIDRQGALQVQRLYPQAVGVFIAPPSIDVLGQRLVVRGQDSAAVIERRLDAAEAELKQAHHFQYVIINQDFACALDDLVTIVEAARLRYTNQRARCPDVFAALGI